MKESIKKLKETKKGRALLKLSLYMIFLAFVFILIIVANSLEDPYPKRTSSSTETESHREEKTLTYLDKQKKLTEGEYEYTYNITGSAFIIYMGEFKNKVETGYKETEDDLVKYKIKNGITYRTFLNQEEEYDGLYEGLDENLFDLKTLFETLNSESATIENNKDTKIYKYNLDGKNFEITTDKDSITNIKIIDNTITYDFSYEY